MGAAAIPNGSYTYALYGYSSTYINDLLTGKFERPFSDISHLGTITSAKSGYETQLKMAEKAFRSCYKDLMKGITDPNDVAGSLYGEGLLTANERDQVMQATQTIDQKNQYLLRFLEARISSDSEAFDKLVEIFENEDAYASLAKKLKEKRGCKYVCKRSRGGTYIVA